MKSGAGMHSHAIRVLDTLSARFASPRARLVRQAVEREQEYAMLESMQPVERLAWKAQHMRHVPLPAALAGVADNVTSLHTAGVQEPREQEEQQQEQESSKGLTAQALSRNKQQLRHVPLPPRLCGGNKNDDYLQLSRRGVQAAHSRLRLGSS